VPESRGAPSEGNLDLPIFGRVSGLAYYAFMATWLNVFMLVGLSRTVQIVLGVMALVIGVG
jgi:hypothetical protein